MTPSPQRVGVPTVSCVRDCLPVFSPVFWPVRPRRPASKRFRLDTPRLAGLACKAVSEIGRVRGGPSAPPGFDTMSAKTQTSSPARVNVTKFPPIGEHGCYPSPEFDIDKRRNPRVFFSKRCSFFRNSTMPAKRHDSLGKVLRLLCWTEHEALVNQEGREITDGTRLSSVNIAPSYLT